MKIVQTAKGPAFVIDRRQLVLGGASFAAAFAFPSSLLALAAPHTFKHGAFDISVVSDGHLILPLTILAPEAPPEELAALVKEFGIGEGPDQFVGQTNAPLIRSGADQILLDTGSGENFQPTAGKLEGNLTAAGIDPSSITKVVFTHAHPDHIWGTLRNAELRYPNASYYIAASEWDFWMDPDLLTKMPKEMEPFITGAQKNLSAVKDRVTMLKAGDEVVSGLSVLDTPGHTPGHVSFLLAGGDGLIITGDAITSPIFFPHPDWKFGFDAIPDLAIANRKALLDRAATDKAMMLGYHWPYPGLGRAERKGGAYRYVPAG